MNTRKTPTESEVRRWLQEGRLTLPPLRFDLRKVEPRYSGSRPWDYEIEARWNEQTANFAVEYKSLFNPKAFDDALRQCRSGAAMLPKNCLPMLMLPFLRNSQLEELERSGISGVDWCGNGVVVAQDRFRVYRSGEPNRFATYSPIKNIYRKNTSMVARVFLASPTFDCVGDIMSEVNRRDLLATNTWKTPMSMGTVSKALKQLEDDLIITRGPQIQLLQAEKLLDQLQQNYEPPGVKPVRLKVECSFDQLPHMIGMHVGPNARTLVATGLSSVSRYATMQRDDVLGLYCPDARQVQSVLPARETDRFHNVELTETTAQPLYFDARPEDGFHWASPVQTWLELMRGDKRDRETADQVKDQILRRVQGGN